MEKIKQYLDSVANECSNSNTEPTNTLLGEFNRGMVMGELYVSDKLSDILNEVNEEQKRAYYKTGDIISFLAGGKMDTANSTPISIDEWDKAIRIMREIQRLIKPSFEK